MSDGAARPRPAPTCVRRKAVLRPADHRIRRFALPLILAGGVVTGTAAPAMAAPSSIQAKRAEVARIQSQLAAIDDQVGRAAEAYNGARWHLGVVQDRITVNHRNLVLAGRSLKTARARLSGRVRAIYKQGDVSTAQILLSSGSIVSAVDRVELLNRIERQDANLVGDIRGFRDRARKARRQLVIDRAAAKHELASRARAKERVEGLLRQRQAVLSNAKGELGRMIAAEQERQRRQAEIQRQNALAAQRAAAAARASATSPAAASSAAAAAAASAAPSIPLPSGSGNAAAAQIALRYLGTPYVWGGAAPGGFDCSGLASYAYAQIGKSMPHYTVAIYNMFPKVPYDQLQAGDLVFFSGLGHMGIYLGNGQMVHAPHTGDVVRIASMSDRMGGYVGAVRP